MSTYGQFIPQVNNPKDAGDYSKQTGERRQSLMDEAVTRGHEQDVREDDDGDAAEKLMDLDNRMFINPGAADYGGDGGVEYYRQRGIEGGQRNDQAQKTNSDALGRSVGNIYANRGEQATENQELAFREGKARSQQIDALGLSRDAAAGLAPSAAQGQTTLGMNDVMSQQSGTMGSARGLAGLSGAQTIGGSMAGQSAGNLAMQGGMNRSKEIGSAIGMYGTQAGDVRGQDLQRLAQNTQNSTFNAKLNDDWKMGNANLAASQGRLGLAQGATDLAWMGEQTKGADKQFQYDQEMAAMEAGADADAVGARLAKNREQRENTRSTVNGAVGVGATAVGSFFGGPAGGAGGAAAGSAFAAGTKDWW